MRRVVGAALAAMLIAAACGEIDSVVSDGPTATDAAAAATPPSTTTTAVSTATLPPDELDLDGALDLISSQWSAALAWGDGFVILASTASGGPLIDRDSPTGRLFPDEVHDALEEAGVTDVVAAYSVIQRNGLLGVVQEVLADHPEAWDELLAGPGTLSMTASVTEDGASFDERSVPFLGAGLPTATYSTGARAAVLLGNAAARSATLATTESLDDWTLTELDLTNPAPPNSVAVPLDDEWYVAVPSPSGPSAWIVDRDGVADPAPIPPDGACCAIRATDLGLVGHDLDSYPAARLFYSADGRTWDDRPLPEGVRGVVGTVAVDGGIVIATSAEDGEHSYWWGRADASGWEPVELPADIDFAVWIRGDHHRGVAQLVRILGRGRGGAIETPVPHSFVVEDQGLRFELDLGETIAVRITMIATGSVILDRQGTASGDIMSIAMLETQFRDNEGTLVATLPTELLSTASDEAVAVVASENPVLIALREGTYLLSSADGRAFSGRVLGEGRELDHPWIAAVNGDRILVRNSDGDEMWVEALGT